MRKMKRDGTAVLNGLYGSGGYFFVDQFADDLGGAFVVGFRFRPEVVHRHIIQPQKADIPAAYETGAVGSCFGHMSSPVFIKRIRFFFSQFRHNVLLSFEQREQRGAALHGMKHLHPPYAHQLIIHYFKRIGIAVKPDEQVFRRVAFLKHRVIFGNFERPPYIGFAHTVFKSRLSENNSNVHCFDYTMPSIKPQYRAKSGAVLREMGAGLDSGYKWSADYADYTDYGYAQFVRFVDLREMAVGCDTERSVICEQVNN
jgi:hypothetical protein